MASTLLGLSGPAVPDITDPCICEAPLGATYLVVPPDDLGILIRTTISQPCQVSDWESICDVCDVGGVDAAEVCDVVAANCPGVSLAQNLNGTITVFDPSSNVSFVFDPNTGLVIDAIDCNGAAIDFGSQVQLATCGDLGGVQGDIATNTASIATNATSITTNAAGIASINAELDNLQDCADVPLDLSAPVKLMQCVDPATIDCTTLTTSTYAIQANGTVANVRGRLSVRTILADATLVPADDNVVIIDATGGDVTFTLTVPADCDPNDVWVKRKDISTNVVAVNGGGATIDGCVSIELSHPAPLCSNAGESAHLVWDGAGWIII